MEIRKNIRGINSLLFVSILLFCFDAIARPIGFGENTTGGAGGKIIIVTTLADAENPAPVGSLREALLEPGPKIIRFAVNGTIRIVDNLDLNSNTTVDGRGADITIDGGNQSDNVVEIRDAGNVIIRNLKLVNAGNDGIQIKGSGASNIWIDHITITDAGDELIGITQGASDITISWCKFTGTDPGDYKQARGILIGSSPSDTNVDNITIYGSWWDNIQARQPRIVNAKVHSYNNLHQWDFAGIVASHDSQCYVENSIFDATGAENHEDNAYQGRAEGGDPRAGDLKAVGNLMLNGASGQENNPSSVFNPSDFYSYTARTADSSLRADIEANAGWQDLYPKPNANRFINGYEQPFLQADDHCRSIEATTGTFNFQSNPPRIIRTSGSFLDDGMLEFQPLIEVLGAGSNSGTYRAKDIQPGHIAVWGSMSNATNVQNVTVRTKFKCRKIPTSYDQRISTSNSFNDINWGAGRVIAFRPGDYTSKGRLNCGSGGTASNPVWLIHEKALTVGVNGGPGYNDAGTMTHPYHQSNSDRVRLRGYEVGNCNHVIMYGLTWVGNSSDDVVIRLVGAGTGTIVSHNYCNGYDLRYVSRCERMDSAPDDVLIQNNYQLAGEPVHNQDQNVIGISGRISNDRIHIVNNEHVDGRITWGGSSSGSGGTGKNGAVVGNDIYFRPDIYAQCSKAKNPTCRGGKSCNTGDHYDSNVFDPNGLCQSAEGPWGFKGGCEADQKCIVAHNRFFGMRAKPGDFGGTSSEWHIPFCMGNAFTSSNVLWMRNLCYDTPGGFHFRYTSEQSLHLKNIEVTQNIIDNSNPDIVYYESDMNWPPAGIAQRYGFDNSIHHNLVIGNNNQDYNYYYRYGGSDDNDVYCNTFINGNQRNSLGSKLSANRNAYIGDTGSSVRLGDSTYYENSSVSAMNFGRYCFYDKLISEKREYCIDNVTWTQADAPTSWQNLCDNFQP